MRSDETDPRVAQGLIDALDEGRLPEPPADADDEAAAELRVYGELLGLLPEGLEARPPSPKVKERVMAMARGDRTAGDGARSEVASLAAAREARATEAAEVAEVRVRPRLPAWLGLAAAAVLAMVVGLAVFSAYLYGRLGQQEATIAELAENLELAERQATTVANAQASLAGHLALVATPGNVLCPLRPTGERPMYPAAYGLLFLSGSHDGWYIRVLEVDPAPSGHVYRLWFLLGEEMVAKGDLHAAGDGSIELAGYGLPDPGVMSGALITLEEAGEEEARPAGPEVLFGDERVEMI
ncbi:MAG TPA: anti-sigma factor [Thermoanaerobaculia bacterium]|nr:anti-sigma factor [Thermoanaerobaculia bacterium]